jgi:hypothetical protein
LQEELGRTEKEGPARRLPLITLPEATLGRFEKDGRGASGRLGKPFSLLNFSKKDKGREWIVEPASYLRKYFGEMDSSANVSIFPQDFPKKEVLSDWRYFFDPNEGLISQVLMEDKIVGISGGQVYYDDQENVVTVTLEFLVEEDFHFGALDLREGGGLRGVLRQFLGWGKLIVHTSDRYKCFWTPWPGGEPRVYRNNPEKGLFKLEWSIPHYLKTRCQP